MSLKGAIQPVSPYKNEYLIMNEIETSGKFHPIPAFPNGETEFITKYAPEGKVHVEAGPK